jgi:hypothetical protein
MSRVPTRRLRLLRLGDHARHPIEIDEEQEVAVQITTASTTEPTTVITTVPTSVPTTVTTTVPTSVPTTVPTTVPSTTVPSTTVGPVPFPAGTSTSAIRRLHESIPPHWSPPPSPTAVPTTTAPTSVPTTTVLKTSVPTAVPTDEPPFWLLPAPRKPKQQHQQRAAKPKHYQPLDPGNRVWKVNPAPGSINGTKSHSAAIRRKLRRARRRRHLLFSLRLAYQQAAARAGISNQQQAHVQGLFQELTNLISK